MENRDESGPETPGPLGGFAVYSTAGLEEDTPDPADGEDQGPDFGERYIEPEDIPVTHSIRMRPGSSLSIGRRNVYRTDRRGVPHFAPGWLPAHARIHYTRVRIAGTAAAAVLVAVSAAMAASGAGSNAEYLALAVEENLTPATVTGVVRTTDPDPDRIAMYRTVEETTFTWSADGSAHSGTHTASSTDSLPPLAEGTRWSKGEDVMLYVDRENPAQFVPRDPGQPGRVNMITLLPLLPVPAAVAAAVISRRRAGVMGQLENAA
ncbi:hypothetical protein [Arthrobacter sp. IK3]|uniref:hypothetical protein n=1 Tax=Arthrobacter sp. IK3 TaxID=3448169 RepID=UPI003EE17C9D